MKNQWRRDGRLLFECDKVGNRWTAEVQTNLTRSEQPSNDELDQIATLMHAAPELLDALERVDYCLANNLSIGPGLLRQVHAAIAKAKS